MRYIPNSAEKLQNEMLSSMGIQSMEELFSSIPENVQLGRDLKIPLGMSESDELELFQKISLKNTGAKLTSFLGGGSYDHFVPLVIDSLISRAEFFTSYTPYQPEASQGTLQAIFEFQTFITMLTGMEVANASMYDGSTALAEAVLMASRLKKNKRQVLYPETCHPHYIDVLKTYTRNLNLELIPVPCKASGQIDDDFLMRYLGSNTLCLIVQQPNYLGVIEDLHRLGELLKSQDAMFICCISEAISLSVLEPPGNAGVDIVVGEAQSFGIPLSFGGPYLGFMATKDEFKRNLPGRIVGKTLDIEGRDGFVLTLSTREQHIRREKATSNICTNQNLIMMMATMFLTLMGKKGLKEMAYQNAAKTSYLKSLIEPLSSFKFPYSGPVFNEFVVECPKPASEVILSCLQDKVLPGIDLGKYYPQLPNYLLINVTEKRKKEELDQLAACFKAIDMGA
ncbi:MAG: aminomethyl-transferring glycine dehydrogenase subunit GcvPA [SAR324 cluster bacterium]|nr:aminomethyl-transferring glycine dehydrogenase subunit GcvPA [SAR324 cluster bacterium]